MQLVGKDGEVSITESPALRLGRITRSCRASIVEEQTDHLIRFDGRRWV